MAQTFTLASPAFEHGATIPVIHAHQGFSPRSHNESPPLTWQGEPPQTKSFALILNDPDAVSGTFTHWVIYNIPASVHELPANLPSLTYLTGSLNGTMQGKNDYGTLGYGGPKPPVGTGIHRYIFTLYALDRTLDIDPKQTTGPILEQALQSYTIGKATLIGLVGATSQKSSR